MYQIINEFNGYNAIFLDVLAALTIIYGVLVIVTKNPVASVLFLIFLFSHIALYLITISIIFLGLSYLLVYVGAVSILFLFILMLINIRVSELILDTNNNIPLAIMVSLYFYSAIYDILPKNETSFFSNVIYSSDKEVFYVSSYS
jgi:NADH-ubiquinone oxidoreductase chain 6